MALTFSPTTALLALQAAAAPAHHGFLHFFRHLGLIGLLPISAVDSSFVPLPIPGVTDVLLILFAAAHANLFLLVFIATLGSAIGGFFSHAVGQAGGMAFLEKHVSKNILNRVTDWMEHHALLAVSLPALLPPPMPLSPFVLVAGAAHMSRKKFMWAFTLSRFLRHCIAVWIGVRYGRTFLHLWSHFSDKWATTILICLWTVIILFTIVAIWKLVRTSREMNLTPRKPSATAQPDAAPTN